MHKYLYSELDPVNNWDPSGYSTIVNVLIATGLIALISSAAAQQYFFRTTLGAFAGGDSRGLIYNFLKPPTGLLVGIGGSFPPSRYILSKFGRNPGTLALAAGLVATSVIAGIEIIVPKSQPDRMWYFGYAGLSIDFAGSLRLAP